MPGPSTYRTFLRKLEQSGYTLELTGSHHVRITHPGMSRPVINASSPSSPRAVPNLRAKLRRAEKEKQP